MSRPPSLLKLRLAIPVLLCSCLTGLVAIDVRAVHAQQLTGTIEPSGETTEPDAPPVAPMIVPSFPPVIPSEPFADRVRNAESRGDESPPVRSISIAGETTYLGPDSNSPIRVTSDFAQRWDDNGVEKILLRGNCRIVQDRTILLAHQMVAWRQPSLSSRTPQRLYVYLEKDAQIIRPASRDSAAVLTAELESTADIQWQTTRATMQDASGRGEPISQRAAARLVGLQRTDFQPTQLVVPRDPTTPRPLIVPSYGSDFPLLPPGPAPRPGGFVPGGRRVSIQSRNLGVPYIFKSELNTRTTPPELVATFSRGVNIVIEGVPIDVGGVVQYETLDLSADRIILWTDGSQISDPQGSFDIGPNTPLQVYLEGNIVVRQGRNIAEASQAFYDVQERRGLFLNAEVKVFVEQLGGNLRLRADSIRQRGENDFHAQNAWVTTSQLGVPGYRIQASDIFVEERPLRPWIGPGFRPIDPRTGLPEDDTGLYVTSLNNRVYIGDVPTIGVPYISGPADAANIPIRGFNVSQDSIFGFQVQTELDLDSLFGMETPPGWDINLLLDYFSERGPAIGTTPKYEGVTNIFGPPSRYEGFGNFYYIHDDGSDVLGLDRRSLEPPRRNRGRATLRHRQVFPFETWVTGELGYLSDRNFLEQYYENEWDEGKDNETLISVTRQLENLTGSILFQTQLNEFSNVTEWYPRGDLTLLAEPLFDTPVTWSSHSMIGYGQINQAQAPSDPADTFTPLPYFADVSGGVAMTRHEVDAPFNLGPAKIVPYALGEAAYWGEDLTGDDLARLYGSVGVRGNIMFTRTMPWVQDRILGLNGLAHKMTFDFDYYLAESSEDLSRIAQYNQFDDNAQERFRSRFELLEFGGVLPAQFDPRFYAVRSGAGRSVTDPYHELVDDQHVLNLGWRHRWQTKAGWPGQQRIRDWMTLDLEASIFPNEDRDNFGETFGLLTGRYTWNFSDRTMFLANGLYDTFDDGQEIWNVGVLSQRSARGSVYVGFNQIRGGPIDSQVIAASFSYRMSPKWVSAVGASYDLAENEDRGQSLTISRIGEWSIWHFGLGYDASKDNVGVGLSFEPKFGSYTGASPQLSSLLGIR